MDKAIFAVGVIAPVMTIPQVYKIYHFQNAAGVSIWTWAAYLVNAIFWLVYGALHEEKPIIFTYTLLAILNAAIVVGITLYG